MLFLKAFEICYPHGMMEWLNDGILILKGNYPFFTFNHKARSYGKGFLFSKGGYENFPDESI